ncbi:Tetratricopeptide repeat protein 25 [Gryllus bimaculatus]|nr:Tetratricopeptide repeat protein 25 [Gryllus bimaculatus]
MDPRTILDATASSFTNSDEEQKAGLLSAGAMTGRGGRCGKGAKKGRRSQRSAAAEAKLHCDEALGHVKAGNYAKALRCYHSALELSPRDRNALVARARCYLLLGQPQLALQDAETALRPDKTFIKAIFQKAEALYHLGDFEHSLVFYHRGLRLRPELEGFRLGAQKAQEAIENTIGGKTFPGLPAEHYLLPLGERAGAQSAASSTAPAPAPALPSPGGSSSAAGTGTGTGAGAGPGTAGGSASSGARTLSEAARERRQARHLLGELCVDKDYLEQLLRHPDIKCLHQEKADHIAAHARDGVAFLASRQEFWRQQKSSAPSGSAKGARQQRNGAR